MPPDKSEKCYRCGLIAWAILKTLLALGSFGYIFLGIYYLFIKHGMTDNVWLLAILTVLQVAVLVDVCMSIMLIVGESKKSYNIVTAYFHYAVYAVIAAIIIITSYTMYELAVLWGVYDNAPWRELRTFNLSDIVKLATIGTIYVLLEVFIVYLLRIETVALKNHEIQKLNSKGIPSEAESFVDA